MKKSIKLTALLLSFVLLLNGCSLFEGNESEKLPITFEYNSEQDVLRNGRLIFTIDSVRVIDNIADLPKAGGIRDDGFIYTVYHIDGKCEALEYPELVRADGSFASGTYMVLVEMTATSEDAEMWTTEDLNANGGSKGGILTRIGLARNGPVSSIPKAVKLRQEVLRILVSWSLTLGIGICLSYFLVKQRKSS